MTIDDDAADSLSLMMEQERTTYSCLDYLNANSANAGEVGHAQDTPDCHGRLPCRSRADRITPDDRTKIVDWCYEIVDQCRFDRETVAAAMNIVDRFMSRGRTSSSQGPELLYDRHQYQLLAMTSLYISIKLHERTVFSSDDFSAASRGVYSTRDIEAMELRILHGLEWRICVPTPLRVGCQIVEILESICQDVSRGTWEFLHDELAYQTENAVREYYFSKQCSSTVAIVAIMNGIEQVNDADHKPLMDSLVHVLKKFKFDRPDVLMDAMERLRILVEENEERAEDTTVSVTLSDQSISQSLQELQHHSVDMTVTTKDNRIFYSPRSSVATSEAEDDNDDSSCITIY
jgi:hypothetical protein